MKHIWLIKGNEIINGKKLNERSVFSISNKLIEMYKKYEITNKLDDIKIICNDFKNKNNINQSDL